jgi:hypothetical protein
VTEEGGESKVGNLQVAISRDKDILRLEVSMCHALGVHIADGVDHLGEVEMCNILAQSDIGFDLVEKITSIRQLHGNPSPVDILAACVVLDDVLVAAEMGMKSDFVLELSRLQVSDLERVVLVYKFDSNDWGDGVWGKCLADTVVVRGCYRKI